MRSHSSFALQRPPAQQQGLSLIEILIGVTVGLIGIIMMFQLLNNWEVRKRTTAAGSDAQTTGSIAFYRLQQDIQQAGYGFGMATRLGCTVNASLAGTAFSFTLAPVRIIDGASGAPDTIQVLYGNASTMPESYEYDARTATSKTLVNTRSLRSGLNPGNLLLVEPSSGNCGLVEITSTTNIMATGRWSVNHVNGIYTLADGSNTTSQYNPVAGFTGASVDGNLYNLGSGPRWHIWSLDDVTKPRVLRIANALAGEAANEIADGIVNLQAQYGLDADGNTTVETWRSTALTAAEWPTLRAVRVALLARSQQYESTLVTSSAPQTGWIDTVTNSPIPFAMTNLDGTTSAMTGPNDWHRYRYRVYETTIPLRNIVWGSEL